ncbi:ABC transporter permease [Aerosakkonemataceae cyanobacterium BLCC-F154]|uniref:ABC transporter permease n=1 Tax=Floridaenema fluviatile BLCC-F154 TaxID=3153640 RepID=A0ABV4YFS5_9CYAN
MLESTENKGLAFLRVKLIKAFLPEVLSILCILGFWQFGANLYPKAILPSPGETLTALMQVLFSRSLPEAIASTMLHSLGGFSIAAVAGISLGLIAEMQGFIRRMLMPIATALQGIPPIAWIVLSVLWFGMGDANSIFTVALAIFPLIFIATIEGLQTTDPRLLEMAKTYKLQGLMLVREVYLPQLISILFPAIASSLGLAWRVGIMSEVLSGTTGIGAELNKARGNFDTATVMAWIVIIAVLILTWDYLILRRVRNYLMPWRNQTSLREKGGFS